MTCEPADHGDDDAQLEQEDAASFDYGHYLFYVGGFASRRNRNSGLTWRTLTNDTVLLPLFDAGGEMSVVLGQMPVINIGVAAGAVIDIGKGHAFCGIRTAYIR